MKKLIILIVLTLTSFGISSSLINKETTELPRRYLLKEDKKNSLTYLNSFNDVYLDINDKDTTFLATKNLGDFNNTELINYHENNNDDLTVEFKTTYVKQIGMIYNQVYLRKSDEILAQINVLGHPFYNDKIKKNDIKFEFFGESFLASDLLENSIDIQRLADKKYLYLDPGGSETPVVNVTTPVLGISTSIINAGDNLLDIGLDNLKSDGIVDFWRDGPLHYLLWYVKAEKAFSNYEKNKMLDITSNLTSDGYIDDQDLFNEWRFGFKSFDANGCGVVSLYNLLVSQGRNPDLASLILLCELMNADLGLGFLGLNPISNELMKIISTVISLVFQLMKPYLHMASPAIALVITERLISDQLDRATKWWEDMLIWASLPIQYTITLAAVNGAIELAVASVSLITEFYLKHVHGIPDILSILGYNSLDQSLVSYDKFNEGRISYGYFIVTFFNEVPNIIENLKYGAHTIFVKRVYLSKSELITYNNKIKIANNFYDLFNIINEEGKIQFISGITIKG